MRIAIGILVSAGAALLAAACGGSPASRAPTTSSQASSALAFARCMRSHGVARFPDPGPQGDFPAFEAGVPKQVSAAADGACRHLLSSGETATPQQLQQKLAFGVKVAECLRGHGYPSFPDPTRLGSQGLPPGIDPHSPRFQAQETACETETRKALGLP